MSVSSLLSLSLSIPLSPSPRRPPTANEKSYVIGPQDPPHSTHNFPRNATAVHPNAVSVPMQNASWTVCSPRDRRAATSGTLCPRERPAGHVGPWPRFSRSPSPPPLLIPVFISHSRSKKKVRCRHEFLPLHFISPATAPPPRNAMDSIRSAARVPAPATANHAFTTRAITLPAPILLKSTWVPPAYPRTHPTGLMSPINMSSPPCPHDKSLYTHRLIARTWARHLQVDCPHPPARLLTLLCHSFSQRTRAKWVTC